MTTDTHIRVILGERQYAAVPACRPKSCTGCVFGPIDSPTCERGKNALDETLRRRNILANACATSDTIFIHDNEAGWAKYLHDKIAV